MISMPLLVAECIAFGIATGYFVSIHLLGIDGTYYVANMVRWTRSRDITRATDAPSGEVSWTGHWLRWQSSATSSESVAMRTRSSWGQALAAS